MILYETYQQTYPTYYFEGLYQLITIMQLYIHDPALDIPPRCMDSVRIADRPVTYKNVKHKSKCDSFKV